MHAVVIGCPECTTVAGVAAEVCNVVGDAAVKVARLEEVDPLRECPDLVVIVHLWPDEFTRMAVDDVLGRFPLSRLICVLGPWCQSCQRSRDLWPPAVCVSLTQLTERLARELHILAGQVAPLPVTASREETFLFNHQPVMLPSHVDLAGSIVTGDPDVGEWLQDVLSQVLRIVKHPPRQKIDVMILDADPWDDVSRSIPELGRPGRMQRIVAFTGEVDGQRREMSALGIRAVVSKQASVEEIQRVVVSVAGKPPSTSARLGWSAPRG